MATQAQDWLTYEWKFEGISSVTRVDPRFMNDRDARADYSLLMRLTISPINISRRPSAFDTWRIDRAAQKASAAAGRSSVSLVGTRSLANALEMYFYGNVEDALHNIASEGKRSGLKIDYIIWNEPFWETYERDLYPSPAQIQTINNGEITQKLAQHGDDMVSTRRINHYCSFLSEVNRIGFEAEALKAGFALDSSFYSPESDYPHCCCVRNMTSVDKPSIDAATTKLIAIVSKFDGRYDYWDCPIMRKTRTKNAPVRR